MYFLTTAALLAAIGCIILVVISGKKLFSQPAIWSNTQNCYIVDIPEARNYSIWAECGVLGIGRTIMQVVMTDINGNQILLSRSLSQTKGIDKILIYSFYAQPGKYNFYLTNEPYHILGQMFSSSTPKSQVLYEIRPKSSSAYAVLFGVGIFFSIVLINAVWLVPLLYQAF